MGVQSSSLWPLFNEVITLRFHPIGSSLGCRCLCQHMQGSGQYARHGGGAQPIIVPFCDFTPARRSLSLSAILSFLSFRSSPPTPPTRDPTLTLTMAFNLNALRGIYNLAIPAAIGVSFLSQSIYDVRGGSRAVIFDRLSGVKEGVISEGTHFLIPWLQKSIIFDVRTKPRNIATTTGSKDLQMVSLTLRVLHRPEVQALPKIYQVCLFSLHGAKLSFCTGDIRADMKTPVPWPRL